MTMANEIEFTDFLVGWIDELLIQNKLEEARKFLNFIDVEKIHPNITTAFAALTAHAQLTIGESWNFFMERLIKAMKNRWCISEDRCDKFIIRCKPIRVK